LATLHGLESATGYEERIIDAVREILKERLDVPVRMLLPFYKESILLWESIKCPVVAVQVLQDSRDIYQGCATLSSWTGESEMPHADVNRRRVAA
jgi:hypothetical protein